jgi:urocanate hydratase
MTQSMVILSITEFSFTLRQHLISAQYEHRLSPDEFEDLFDWVVTEAMTRILHFNVKGHVRCHNPHDIYRIVYDEVGAMAELWLSRAFVQHKLFFMQDETIKAMITFDQILLVRNITKYITR